VGVGVSVRKGGEEEDGVDRGMKGRTKETHEVSELEPELAPPSGVALELGELAAPTAPRACDWVCVSVPVVNVGGGAESVAGIEAAVIPDVAERPLAVFESAPRDCVCPAASVEATVRLADAVSFVAAPALALALAGFPAPVEVASGFWFWFPFLFPFCAVSVGLDGGASCAEVSVPLPEFAAAEGVGFFEGEVAVEGSSEVLVGVVAFVCVSVAVSVTALADAVSAPSGDGVSAALPEGESPAFTDGGVPPTFTTGVSTISAVALSSL
jgi:hypothetical protein